MRKKLVFSDLQGIRFERFLRRGWRPRLGVAPVNLLTIKELLDRGIVLRSNRAQKRACKHGGSKSFGFATVERVRCVSFCYTAHSGRVPFQRHLSLKTQELTQLFLGRWVAQ